jgi:hypothetical protein
MPAVLPRLRTPALFVAALVAIVSCGESGGDAERFCGEIAANAEALTNPQLISSDDIEPLLELYRDIGDLAPLAVEEDWNQLVSAYETASTVVVGDQASEQEALAAIYSSEESAAMVDRWLRENCAVDIGPVATIVSHTPVTAPPPSAPPSTPATTAP